MQVVLYSPLALFYIKVCHFSLHPVCACCCSASPMLSLAIHHRCCMFLQLRKLLCCRSTGRQERHFLVNAQVVSRSSGSVDFSFWDVARSVLIFLGAPLVCALLESRRALYACVALQG